MKLRTTLGTGLAAATVTATLACMSASAMAAPAPAPWNLALAKTPLDVATTADGSTVIVLLDGGQDSRGWPVVPDIVQWYDATTGALANSVTLPTDAASALAVAADGTVGVVGQADNDYSSAGPATLWTIDPSTSTVTTTTLSDIRGQAESVAFDGTTAIIGGDTINEAALWSVPLSDPTTVTTTWLGAEDPSSVMTVPGVGIADDGSVYAVVDTDTPTSNGDSDSTQLWQVSDASSVAASASPVGSGPYSTTRSIGLAVADGLVQVAVAAGTPGTQEAHLLTYDTATQTTTDRDLGIPSPSAVTTDGDQVVVSTENRDFNLLVPEAGTTSYTVNAPAPELRLDSGGAQKLVVGADRAIGIRRTTSASSTVPESSRSPHRPPRLRRSRSTAPPRRSPGPTPTPA